MLFILPQVAVSFDAYLNPLFTESHGGQNGMRAGTA